MLIDLLLFHVSELLVRPHTLHKHYAPLLVLLLVLIGDPNHFGLGIIFVSNFEISLSFFQSAFTHNAFAQICDKARTHRVLVLLILEDGVADLGVPFHPLGLSFDLDSAFNSLSSDLQRLENFFLHH